MRGTPLLPSLSGPLWPGVVTPDRVLSMGQIEQNWIAWNRTVLTFKLHTLDRLNCWIRLFTLCVKKKKKKKKSTELFEIELLICIEMDLALNN